jgi:acetyltransferase-like isoleucine patch superfamily enzyme
MPGDLSRSEALAEARNLLNLLLFDRRGAVERLRRGVGNVRARILFRDAVVGRRVGASGHVRVVADGRISIGEHVQFLGGMIPSQILCARGGELHIGAHCGFNYGVVVDCRHSIRIGQRCIFGSMSSLRDVGTSKSGPIVLEDDVWIAHGAVVEPGVCIGAGSVVSAGSVVTADVPPDSLVIGDPAESFPLGSDGKRVRRHHASSQMPV